MQLTTTCGQLAVWVPKAHKSMARNRSRHSRLRVFFLWNSKGVTLIPAPLPCELFLNPKRLRTSHNCSTCCACKVWSVLKTLHRKQSGLLLNMMRLCSLPENSGFKSLLSEVQVGSKACENTKNLETNCQRCQCPRIERTYTKSSILKILHWDQMDYLMRFGDIFLKCHSVSCAKTFLL